ncbi:hypothetical protein B0T10DRAFT_492394 [Thelonectria olida]|uniref:Uncharacterized protein n=1 Tax=Thelonectria olida TaxID=1576542 RepID=A0A9P8W1J6_9HYPO|nr:hypothetical protein B0T10DRAFT_492394 [Thelonectria olida]
MSHDDAFAMCFMLYAAYDEDLNPRTEMPPSVAAMVDTNPGLTKTLERYRDTAVIKFPNLSTMETFMTLKEGETILLQRQLDEMDQLCETAKDLTRYLAQETKKFKTHSTEWNSMQQQIKRAFLRIETTKHAKRILPALVDRAERVRQDIEKKLEQGRQREREIKRLQELHKERTALVQQLESYDVCLGGVVPASGAYARIQEETKIVTDQLRAFDAEHPGLEAAPGEDYGEMLQVVLRDTAE